MTQTQRTNSTGFSKPQMLRQIKFGVRGFDSVWEVLELSQQTTSAAERVPAVHEMIILAATSVMYELRLQHAWAGEYLR